MAEVKASLASGAAIERAGGIKTALVLSFLAPLLTAHFGPLAHGSPRPATRPFFLGLNGLQGAGKTTLVRHLAAALRAAPYGLPTAVLSIDDLYLPHAEQRALAAQHASNPLLQHRGQPGTHDVPLGVQVFQSLRALQRTQLPAYDKSAFGGEGDRVPEERWEVVNADGREPVQVVVFEGWCVGFRPIDNEQVRAKWQAAKDERAKGTYSGRLAHNELESVEFINEQLREYDWLTECVYRR